MDGFRSGDMFCLVDFKGGRRRRTVVPDTWLSVNDTLCLLPPNATDSDLEVLVRNLAEPGDGWQMLEVSSLETFENYAEAKKQLEKSKETTSQSSASCQRKRKQPSYLVDYATHDSDDGRTPYTVFGVDFDEEAMSENEWVPPPEFGPRIENVSTAKKTIRSDHGPRNYRLGESQLSSQKENIDITCECQSSCHVTFLQEMRSMQKKLDRTNQMVQQLVGGQKQTHSQLERVLQNLPLNQMNGPKEVDVPSQDITNFVQCVLQNPSTSSAQKDTESSTSFPAAEDTSCIAGDQPSTSEQWNFAQQWHSEWEDWIVPGDVPENAKIKIEASTEPLPTVDSFTMDTSEVTDVGSKPTYDLDDCTDSRSFNLPIKYFSPGLLNCLKHGERLEKSKRSQLLTILYDAMSSKTLFPSKEDYREVAEKLIKEFPVLSAGIGINDAVSLWRTALSEKFRTERKFAKKNQTGTKRNRETEIPQTTVEIAQNNTRGIPTENFLPPRADGESDDSIEKHVRWLKDEHGKESRDEATMAQKMELTFPERRRLIVSESASIKILRDTYPCLFEENQFLAEFGRLLSCNVEEVFVQNVKKYGPTIVKLTTRTNFGKYLMEKLAAESNIAIKENTSAKAVPLLIAALANENSSHIVRSISAESVMHPIILYEGESPLDAIRVQINSNNEKICDAIDISRAVVLLMATYYIFGLEYPKEGQTTLQLIQHLLCNISSSARKTKKFLRNVNLIIASM